MRFVKSVRVFSFFGVLTFVLFAELAMAQNADEMERISEQLVNLTAKQTKSVEALQPVNFNGYDAYNEVTEDNKSYGYGGCGNGGGINPAKANGNAIDQDCDGWDGELYGNLIADKNGANEEKDIKDVELVGLSGEGNSTFGQDGREAVMRELVDKVREVQNQIAPVGASSEMGGIDDQSERKGAFGDGNSVFGQDGRESTSRDLLNKTREIQQQVGPVKTGSGNGRQTEEWMGLDGKKGMNDDNMYGDEEMKRERIREGGRTVGAGTAIGVMEESRGYPGDYIDENGNRLRKSLDAFANSVNEVDESVVEAKYDMSMSPIRNMRIREIIQDEIEKGQRSEVAINALREILNNEVMCANCEDIDKLPDSEISKVTKAKDVIKRENWVVEVNKDRIQAKRIVKRKLFGIFDVEVEEKADINVDGEIKDVQKPWWSIFAW